MARSLSNSIFTTLKKRKVLFILSLIAYLALAIVLSGFYKTIPLLFTYASTVSWVKLILSMVLTLIIGFLVSLNLTLVVERIQERRSCAAQGTLATAATIGGLAVGVCPVCITGLATLIFATLGVSFSFATLPFQGIEIQLLLILILALNIKLLTR